MWKKCPFLVLKTDFEVEQGKILVSIQTWDIKKGYNSPGLFFSLFKYTTSCL